MEESDSAPPPSQRSVLEARIEEAPQLVAEHVRLARLLEESGDCKGAAAALQRAQFFLPNGPTILEGLRRLSQWIDTARRPVTMPTAVSPTVDTEVLEEELSSDEPAPEAVLDDELDQLIEGLGKGRVGDAAEVTPPPENDWSDDDGLLATETLAHIFESQNQFAEALSVYQRLAVKESNPEKAAALREKAARLQEKLRKSG